MTNLTIVVVNYNTRRHLRECLASIVASQRNDARGFGDREAERKVAEIVVVDNASSDGSVEMVRADFPQVVLQVNSANLGYGAAANQAIAQCEADYVLLLNSDTRLEPGVAGALQSYLDRHPQVAIAGPRLQNPDGTVQASCYPAPTPLNLFLEESRLGRLAAHIPGLRQRYLRTWRHDKVKAVPWVLGAVLAIRRDAFIAVGGFDPAFYMYFEEIDLCRRLWAKGWHIHFAPVGTVVHFGGASTDQHYAQMQAQLFESTQLFYARHYSRGQAWLLRLLMIPVLVARLVQDTVRYARARTTPQRERSSDMLQVRYRLLRRCLPPPISAARRP